MGIKIGKEYTYLGIKIDNNGTIKPELKKMKKRVNYLINKLYHITKEYSFDKKYYLYTVYIRPYFIYVSYVLNT